MAKETKKKTANAAKKTQNVVGTTKSSDSISTRGRIFQGTVIRKFPKRITIVSERTVKLPKYERFMKKKTRIHARLPDQFAHDVHVGDVVKVRECRPISKTIHHLYIEKVRSADNGGNQ